MTLIKRANLSHALVFATSAEKIDNQRSDFQNLQKSFQNLQNLRSLTLGAFAFGGICVPLYGHLMETE